MRLTRSRKQRQNSRRSRRQRGGLYGMGSTKNPISALIADKDLRDEELVRLIKSFVIVQVLRNKNKKEGGLTARMIAQAHGHMDTAENLDDHNIYDLVKRYADTGESYEEFKSRILALCSGAPITSVAIGLTPKEIKNLFFEVRSGGLLSLRNAFNAGTTDCGVIFQDDPDLENNNRNSIMAKKQGFEDLYEFIDRRIKTGATRSLLNIANSKADQRPVFGQNQNTKNAAKMLANNQKIKEEILMKIKEVMSIFYDKNKDEMTAFDFANKKDKPLTAEYLGSTVRVAGAANSILSPPAAGGRRRTRRYRH